MILTPAGRREIGADVVDLRTNSAGRRCLGMQACYDLISFADGEMDSDASARFRHHLRACVACQRDLVDAVVLQARLSEMKVSRPVR